MSMASFFFRFCIILFYVVHIRIFFKHICIIFKAYFLVTIFSYYDATCKYDVFNSELLIVANSAGPTCFYIHFFIVLFLPL